MKKVLITGAALMLAGGVAATTAAAAEPGVSITGDARARLIYKDSYDFGNSDQDATDTFDSRVRFTVKGTTAGGAYAIARIRLMDEKWETSNIWEDGDHAETDKNIWADKAYIGVPFTDEFTVEAGRYRSNYGNGFLWDDLAMAGVRGLFNTDAVEVEAFYNRLQEGQMSANDTDKMEDNDLDMVGASVKINVNPDWMVGGLAAYQIDDRAAYTETDEDTGLSYIVTPDNEGFFGSIFTKGKAGAFGLEAEWAYMEEGVQDTTDDGMGGYVRGSFAMDALTLSLDLGTTQDGFMPDYYYGFVMMGGDHPIQALDIGEDGDWAWAGFTANFAVSEDLTLTGNLVYASVDGNTDDSLSDAMEISGSLKYSIVKGADFLWYAGYLAPSYDGDMEDDAAFGSYAKLEIKF